MTGVLVSVCEATPFLWGRMPIHLSSFRSTLREQGWSACSPPHSSQKTGQVTDKGQADIYLVLSFWLKAPCKSHTTSPLHVNQEWRKAKGVSFTLIAPGLTFPTLHNMKMEAFLKMWKEVAPAGCLCFNVIFMDLESSSSNPPTQWSPCLSPGGSLPPCFEQGWRDGAERGRTLGPMPAARVGMTLQAQWCSFIINYPHHTPK